MTGRRLLLAGLAALPVAPAMALPVPASRRLFRKLFLN